MPTITYIANDIEEILLDEIICIRKEQNVFQSELANLIGSKQQLILEAENKEHITS
ncbi:MAG: hypothetical protein IJA34_07335 [Lachnospiraceae bacterium]|nr:hypothetical protein [Lachnospiraceae bacterium]